MALSLLTYYSHHEAPNDKLFGARRGNKLRRQLSFSFFSLARQLKLVRVLLEKSVIAHSGRLGTRMSNEVCGQSISWHLVSQLEASRCERWLLAADLVV